MSSPAPEPTILVTRPEPACGETVARLATLGYAALAAPCLVAAPLPVRALALRDEELLVVTSPQAARFLKNWPALHARPVLAVGAATAQLLQEAGFTQIETGAGDAATLPETIGARPAVLLGAPTTGLVLRTRLQMRGSTVRQEDIYQITEPPRLADAAITLLRNAAAVTILFYSARTARSFLTLVCGIDLGPHSALCLSPAIAAVAQQGGFARIETAARPTSEALQALLPALG